VLNNERKGLMEYEFDDEEDWWERKDICWDNGS
jgi:hypothetical protein